MDDVGQLDCQLVPDVQVMYVIPIQSSSGDGNYDVEVVQSVGGVRLRCSCQAGRFGKLCKHALQVVLAGLGRPSSISLDGSLSEVAVLIQSSDIPALLRELETAEQVLEGAKKGVLRARKRLELNVVLKG